MYVLAEVENHVVTLPAGLREVELRSDCYLVSRDFSLYPSIEIQPLEELHSKVLLPVEKLANFSEPLVLSDVVSKLYTSATSTVKKWQDDSLL